MTIWVMLFMSFEYFNIYLAGLSRLGMYVTTQSGSGRQYVGSGRQYVTGSWRNKEFCSECVMCLGALTQAKPQESYFVVVYLFRIPIKT